MLTVRASSRAHVYRHVVTFIMSAVAVLRITTILKGGTTTREGYRTQPGEGRGQGPQPARQQSTVASGWSGGWRKSSRPGRTGYR